MASYTTSAKVVLTVNSRQAQQVIKSLEKEAERLKKNLDRAAASGDKASMKKWQRELNSVNASLKNLTTSTQSVEKTLRNLDRATPKELRSTLRQLESQLNGIQRGTAAWNAHAAKIKAVKAELQKVNATLQTQRSLWSRMNSALNQAQTAIMGAVAALTGLIMAGRKAVNAYAEMEEQMANTRKYTGMTVEMVDKLNQSFKNMDTRTGRDKLNEFAQEAGRLGKRTLEDVQGYVEAADIISVALVDLGEGATQTIAKLTNIFGVEELLGTKEAMLSVGSAVNVLSQNCTASKPYLVNFAQRMAGIGAQAGLTIPQVLALGAVLDANGQKVEMSATAVQKVIMNLANKNQEFAKVVGLDAEVLNATLKRSAKEGLMMYLEALQKIANESGFDNATMVLAPALKEMGLDASRVSTVLATLAMHLDEVKWQMGEADKAFTEASSATREFGIFNNTVQANIDKAKYRVHELAIELGEKLYPIMKHIYTSSSFFLRLLNQIVSFIIEYRVIIGTLVTSITAYYVAVGLATVKTLALKGATMLLESAAVACNYVIGLLKVGIIAFTQGTTAANTAFKALNATMKANPIGLVVAAATALYLAIKNLISETDNFKSRCEKATESALKWEEATLKEQHELDVLIGKLEAAEKGTEAYESAKKQIIDQYGRYLGGLIDEKGEIIDLSLAYDRLTKAVQRSAQMRGIANAKKSIEDDYLKGVSEDLEKLQSALEENGLTAVEASKIVTKVGQAMATDKPIDPATVAAINSASAHRNDFSKKFSNTMRWVFRQNEIGNPAKIVNTMLDTRNTKNQSLANLNAMEDAVVPYHNFAAQDLKWAIESLEGVVKTGQAGNALILKESTKQAEFSEVSVDQAKKLLEVYKEELALRGSGKPNQNGFDSDEDPSGYHDWGGGKDKSKSRGSSSSEKDRFKKEDEEKAAAEAKALIKKSVGYDKSESGELVPYSNYDYLKEMSQIEIDYYDKLLKRKDLSNLERLQMEAKFQEASAKQKAEFESSSVEVENANHDKKVVQIKQAFIDEVTTSEQYNKQLEDEDERHLGAVADIYKRNYAEKEVFDEEAYLKWVKANDQYLSKLAQNLDKKNQELKQKAEKHQQELDKMRDFMYPEEANLQSYWNELAILDEIYLSERVKYKDNKEMLLKIEEAYQKAKLALMEKYNQPTKEGYEKLVQDQIDFLEGEGMKKVMKAVSTMSSAVSDLFSQINSLMQAELDIQTKSIEKKYDKELERAEGNSYRIAKLEKQRDEEIARAKNEANRKMFAMQVIQAVAQTAQNAINAYGAALQVGGLPGLILAPIAAAMAVAAGGIQIAAIKKQQQASEAQGYAEGGFTPKGPKNKEVGIVHAGEWVASQELVNSPRVRPLLEMLDYAQKNNKIGSLKLEDVSRAITAPLALAGRPSERVIQINEQNSEANLANEEIFNSLAATIENLNKRLNEPFVTVNSVTGELGYKEAESKYERLIKNKSPKSYK